LTRQSATSIAIEVAEPRVRLLELAHWVNFKEGAMRSVIFLLCVCLVGGSALADDQVGFRHFQVPGGLSGRGLDAVVWYPADAGGTPITVGENPVLTGQPAHLDAPALAGQHPLVILSHGYGGNWTNQDWLAVALVQHGYVVAALNHPGTTTKDMNRASGAQLWERPRDISRLIDALAADSVWSGIVSQYRVAAIGHSLGGWTVMELAGGRFDADRLEVDCRGNPQLAACQAYLALGAGQDAASRAALAQPRTDPRIRVVVSLDLGLARGFDPASLAQVNIPVLIIAAGAPNPHMPAALESGYLAAKLPSGSTRYLEVPDAAHFSFLPVCKPGAAQLLTAQSPDDVVVCRDGAGGNREAIHRQIAGEVIHFLATNLPPGA
jgi:predicted dienelactone hydrolase